MLLTGKDLRGAYVAIVTPFRNGKIDEDGLKKLIEFQISNGTHGIVAVGTTGESPTLTNEEHRHVIKFIIEQVKGRVPVIAGTGSNSTLEAVEMTQYAAKVGAVASLSVCPYYNKPTQEGICQHFECIAEEGDLPLILYNIPGRTGVNMSVETVARLSKVQNIIGIKEASGNLEHASAIVAACPKDFALLSGDDALTLPMFAIGGKGVVATVSNVAPRLMAELCNEALRGNYEEARRHHYKLLPLIKAIFCETNPVPVKTALSFMGVITNEVRLPLAVLSQENIDVVRKALRELQLV